MLLVVFFKSYWKTLEGLPLYKIDLSRIWNSDSVIKLEPQLGEEGLKGVLIPCPQMKTSKKLMDIARAPDGRIVAFSRLIRYFKSRDEYQHYQVNGEVKGYSFPDEREEFEVEDSRELVDFEIYDPKSESWSSLPQLVLLVPGSEDKSTTFCLLKDEKWMDYSRGTNDTSSYGWSFYGFHIGGGSFIDNAFHVVVYMGQVKKGFSLNIDNPREGWTPCQGKIEAPDFLDQAFLQVGHEDLILTSRMAMRGSTLAYPLGRSMSWRLPAKISVLDTFAEKCVACIVGTGTGMDHSSLTPYIICDLFSIDFSLETPPRLLGTFKYIEREEVEVYVFQLHSMFPISATEESLEEELQQKRSKII